MGKIKITLIYGGQRFKINIDTDLSVYQSKREFETYSIKSIEKLRTLSNLLAVSVAASHQCLQYFGQVLEDDQVISDVINPKRATIVCQNTSIAPTNARASKSASKKPKNVQVSIHVSDTNLVNTRQGVYRSSSIHQTSQARQRASRLTREC